MSWSVSQDYTQHTLYFQKYLDAFYKWGTKMAPISGSYNPPVLTQVRD